MNNKTITNESTAKTEYFDKNIRLFKSFDKFYKQGKIFKDLLVPFKGLILNGNKNFQLYDTAGSYSDLDIITDLQAGSPKIRLPWLLRRKEIEIGRAHG